MNERIFYDSHTGFAVANPQRNKGPDMTRQDSQPDPGDCALNIITEHELTDVAAFLNVDLSNFEEDFAEFVRLKLKKALN